MFYQPHPHRARSFGDHRNRSRRDLLLRKSANTERVLPAIERPRRGEFEQHDLLYARRGRSPSTPDGGEDCVCKQTQSRKTLKRINDANRLVYDVTDVHIVILHRRELY